MPSVRAFTRSQYCAGTFRPRSTVVTQSYKPGIGKCCHPVDRRTSLLSLASGTLACFTAIVPERVLADMELSTYYGMATPPTSYGGYGGNLQETPKYKFSYPSTWKPLTVNKVQKGTQGIDCIVQDGRNKQARAFVVTLGRAGEDNKSFRLTDLESTFQSFVGADYDLQDAVATADEIKSSSREADGQRFYDYLVEGSEAVYKATITVSGGKVYAMFVSSPAKAYKNMNSTMTTMIESFRNI